jgi:DedD protein
MMDNKLKQRLVGATVLIVLAVIFIPQLLDGDPDSTLTEIKLPPEAEGGFTSRIIPLDEPVPAGIPAAVDDAEPVNTEPPPPAVVVPPVEDEPNASVTKPELPVAASSPNIADTWVVQLATVSNEKNALKFRDDLRAKGYTAFVESLQGQKGKVFRVRVGPEAERSAAETLRDKLEKEFKIKGIINRYSP